jgi:hypothetical protein
MVKDPLIRLRGIDFLRIRPHLKVFHDGHLQKNAAAFRNMGKSQIHNLMRLGFCNVPSVKFDAARLRAQKPGNRPKHGGFSRAVGADLRATISPGCTSKEIPLIA